jgi:GDP-4-dehydro-6-deoxy-D-mannose reductase
VRILVTGASGFVGSHLRPALEQAGHEVVPLLSPRRASGARAVDLTDRAVTARAVADAQPDAVVHLAARSQPSGLESVQELLDNNLRAAHSLLEAVRCTAPRAHAIVVSSSAVYGAVPAARQPVVENEPVRPILPYGATKVAVEALASLYAAQGLKIVIVRPFNLVGPGQGAGFVLARFAQQIARIAEGTAAERVIETGPLEPVRDFLDVRDAARSYVTLLEQRTLPGPFNVCSQVPRSVGEVLHEMLALVGVDAVIRPRAGAGTAPGHDVPYQCGSRAAIGKAAGWEPQIPWRQTLQDMLVDWRARIRAEDV